MSDSPVLEKKPSRRKTRRRILGCGVVVALALVVTGWLGVRYVGGASFRAQAEDMIAATFGGEASLGALRLQLLPSPRLVVFDIELRVADAELRVERMELASHVGALARGRLVLRDILASGVVLSLPVEQGDAAQYMRDIREELPLSGFAGNGAGDGVLLPGVSIRGLRVSGSDGLWVAADLAGARGRDDFLELAGGGRVPALGGGAAVQFAVALDGAMGDISGEVNLRGVKADQLSWVAVMWPGLTLDGDLTLGGSLSEGIQGELVGTSRSNTGALVGSYAGVVWFTKEHVVLNDLRWQIPAGDVLANATYVMGEGWQIVLEELKGNRDLMAGLLAYFDGGAYSVVPGADASLDGTKIALVAPNGGPFRFVSGRFRGDGLEFFKGDRVILAGLAAEGRIQNGVFEVTEVTHPQGRASARVYVDYETSGTVVDWSGEIDLATGVLGAIWPTLPPHEARGLALIDEARFSWEPEAGFSVDRLQCSATDLEAMIHPAGSETPAAIREVGGRLQYMDGVLAIERLEAEDVAIQGEIAIDGNDYMLDLTGDIALNSGLTALFLPASIQSPQGRLRLVEARGRFHPKRGLGTDFRAEGALEGAAATWQVGGVAVGMRAVNGTIATGEYGLALQLDLETDIAGPVSFKGEYAGGLMEGTLHAAPTRLAGAFAPPSFQPLLESISGTGEKLLAFDWRGDGESEQLAVRIAESENLSGEMALVQQAGGDWQVDTLSVAGVTGAQPVLSLFGLGVQGEGNARFSISMDDARQLRGTVDFEDASVRAGQFLEKRPGDHMKVAFSGALEAGGYRLKALEVELLEQVISAREGQQGLHIPSLRLDLAALGPLFPKGAGAGGVITGSINLDEREVALGFDSVRLELKDIVSITQINGSVSYRAGFWHCENLALKGEGNDFLLDARVESERWEASLRGTALDLEGLLALRDGLDDFRPQRHDDTTNGSALVGRFHLDVGTVSYHRGRLENVVATVHLSPSSLRVEPFACMAYGGTVEGILSWAYEGRAGVELAFQDVDMQILDGLLFEEPRNVSGPLSGRVSVTYLPGSDVHPLATMSGTIQYEAARGTYGRMGNATRLLTLLKTTELIRLSLPSFRDDGLTFQESSGDFSLENGVATVNSFVIRDRSYAMAGEGKVNFAADDTDLQLHVHLLESVSGIVGSVPILRSTVERFRASSGVRVMVTGSPFQPEFEADRAVKPLRALGAVLSAPFRNGNDGVEDNK